MAYTPLDNAKELGQTAPADKTQIISADGQEVIPLPSSDFIADATMTKDGHDLILQSPDGSVVVIEGYYLADPAPVLQSPDGGVLTPELVDSFAKAPAEYAQNGSLNDATPIGALEEVSGTVTITRTDGTVVTGTVGTPIYEGDVVETSGEGAANIVFIDETSFAISENARMAIDEYVFDPETESGSQNFSVLRGMFVFTSGLIGRDDPDDVEIDTPVGSIGIRGTIIAGDIDPSGESSITVIEGAIVIKNGFGEETLSQQFETVKLGGYDSAIENTGVMGADSVSKTYGSLSAVAPTLFSSISDVGNDAKEAAPASDPAIQEQAPQDSQDAPAGTQESGDAGAVTGEPEPVLQDTATLMMVDPVTGQVDSSFSGDVSFTDSSSYADQVDATVSAGSTTAAPLPAAQPSGTSTSSGTYYTNGQTTPPPPLGLVYDRFGIPDNAVAGHTVGIIKATNMFGDVQFTFGNGDILSANGWFRLIQSPGAFEARVVLTPLGEANIDSTDIGLQIPFTINASRSDGWMNSIDVQANVFDPAAAAGNTNFLNLNNPAALNVVRVLSGVTNVSEVNIVSLGNVGGSGPGADYAIALIDSSGNAYLQVIDGVTNAQLGSLVSLGLATAGGISIAGVNTDADIFNEILIGRPLSPTDPDGEVFTLNAGTAGAPVWTSPSSIGTGTVAGDYFGSSVVNVGDLNNDGRDDYAIGASQFSGTNPNGYVEIKDGATGSNLATPILGGANERLGADVSFAGDFNGDGKLDFAVSAPGAATNQLVLYDSSGAQIASFSGFSTGGSSLPVDYLGDFNGDGFSDLMAGSVGNNQLRVLTGGTAADLTINSVAGRTIIGGGAAGDWNGDGFDDLAVVVDEGGTGVSSIYVVYGGATGIPTDVSQFNSSNSFHMSYTGNATGITISHNNNGGVFSDLLIGLPNGAGGMGETLVVKGRETNNSLIDASEDSNPTNLAVVRASANNQNLIDNFPSTNLFELGTFGGVSAKGNTNNDSFLIQDVNFRSIDGGLGGDSINVNTLAPLDFRNINFEQISGIELLSNQSGGTVTLTLENIFNFLKTSDDGKFELRGVAGSTFVIDAANNHSDDAAGVLNALQETNPSATYAGITASPFGGNPDAHKFVIGSYELYIDNNVNIQVV